MPQKEFHSFRKDGRERAIVFVHGLKGDPEDTWERMATLLAKERALDRYDIHSFGYRCRITPSTLWAGNASLASLAIQFFSRLEFPDMAGYEKFALIGHSSGGLVIQQALVTYDKLTAKTSHVCLFATPSNGAREMYSKYNFWNPQLRDLRRDGPFIQGLRQRWSARFENCSEFWFRVVAGEQDNFVPVESVIGPFAGDFVKIYPGDHVSLIRPENREAGPIQLLVEGLRISDEAERGDTRCDAFLSYNWDDTDEAMQLAQELRARKLDIWMDRDRLKPGEIWAPSIDAAAKAAPAAVIAVGPHGLGGTQRTEMYRFAAGCRLFPVILPTCVEDPKLPAEFHRVQWLDLRKDGSRKLDELAQRIAGGLQSAAG